MEEYAEFYFSATRPLKDGSTRMEHWQNAERQTGKTPDALKEAPERPEVLNYLWEIFLEMSSGREEGVNGPAILSWNTILSYCKLRNIWFSRFELDLVRRLDILWSRKLREKI